MFRPFKLQVWAWSAAFPFVLCFLATRLPAGVGPDDVYLIVNRNVAASQTVADHYCRVRGVPPGHVLVLDLPNGEDISLADYETKLAAPLRVQLQEKRGQVKLLLTTYGVPLRVGPDEPTSEDRAELDRLRQDLEPLEAKRAQLDVAIQDLERKIKGNPPASEIDELTARKNERSELELQIRQLRRRQRFATHEESNAAVDSELALLWQDSYERRGFLPNALYFQVPEADRVHRPTVMTCRLDGPSPDVVLP